MIGTRTLHRQHRLPSRGGAAGRDAVSQFLWCAPHYRRGAGLSIRDLARSPDVAPSCADEPEQMAAVRL